MNRLMNQLPIQQEIPQADLLITAGMVLVDLRAAMTIKMTKTAVMT